MKRESNLSIRCSKMKLILIMILSCILLSCFSNTNDDDIQRSRIMDRLQRVQEAFNQANWDTIMNYYHPNFYHNGQNYYTQRLIWREMTAFYNRISIDIINIDVNEDYAIARFVLYYYDMNNQYGPYIEPEHRGDISYFYYDRGEWWVYGNQKRE